MTEKRSVKVEKVTLEEWSVWWNAAKEEVAYQRELPSRGGAFAYRGVGSRDLRGAPDFVASNVRQCWDENRTLSENECRDAKLRPCAMSVFDSAVRVIDHDKGFGADAWDVDGRAYDMCSHRFRAAFTREQYESRILPFYRLHVKPSQSGDEAALFLNVDRSVITVFGTQIVSLEGLGLINGERVRLSVQRLGVTL